MYSFFEKSMKSPFVMMMNSAVPLQTKRSAPHLGDCATDTGISKKKKWWKFWVNSCRKWKILDITTSYANRSLTLEPLLIVRILEGVKEVKKKMFRSRKERFAQKRSSRGNPKWWKRVKVGQPVPMTFIKVPYTAGSKLVKKFQEVTRKHSFPIKFVKMSGHSLQNFGCIQKKRSVIVQSVSHVFQVEEGFSNWRFYRFILHIPPLQPPGRKAWPTEFYCRIWMVSIAMKKWDKFRNRFNQLFWRKIYLKISKWRKSRHPKQGQICIKSKK